MKNEQVAVYNTQTGTTGKISRHLFEHSFFNPDGLLIAIEENSGCYDCGTEPAVEIDFESLIPPREEDLLTGDEPQTEEDED